MKKTIICPQCGGHGFNTKRSNYIIWSERCAQCNGTGEIEVPITNGDALRSMSDEEFRTSFLNLSVTIVLQHFIVKNAIQMTIAVWVKS